MQNTLKLHRRQGGYFKKECNTTTISNNNNNEISTTMVVDLDTLDTKVQADLVNCFISSMGAR